MLSTCPFVCPSVRRSSLSTCERYTSKTNEPTSMQIDINLSTGQGHDRSTSGVRSSKVKVTGGEVIFRSLAETSYSIPGVE